MKKMPRIAVGFAILVSVLAVSCTTYKDNRRASEAMKTENWDAAVYYYLEALSADPENAKIEIELERARLKAAERHFRQGMRFKEAGELERAMSELELAVQLDPTHQYAEVELGKVRKDLAILSQQGGEAKLEAIKRAASEMKVKPPLLNPASNEPITLEFRNPTSVKDIYKAIGQAFGINILFDPKLKDDKLSLELKNVTARQALETVMQAAGHFYKVLDEKTIIVVEDTPQNRRDYEDLVVKTFFLSNADVKDINNMLRALIDARRIAINEQLNAITIRDTADKVAIAERLINTNDKAKAEVLVDVELLQVDSSKIRDIGTSLSSYTYNFSLDPTAVGGDATSGRIPLPNLKDITRSMWGMVVPNLTLNLINSAGEAETLAQPQMRITEGEKGNLIIGDKVPIPTTTFNTSNTVGGNIVPITAFQYQDVGIKIDLEPRVHHNNEVTLKLQVEVSDLGEYVEVSPGQKQPKITTRSITSVIRLKDGETSLLAGLLKYNKRTAQSGLPWLSDLPVIGGLFRDNSSNLTQTDLILTLTPHIIRNPDITEEDLAPIWVGTENRITIFGNSPRVRSSSTESPFETGRAQAIGISPNDTLPPPQPLPEREQEQAVEPEQPASQATPQPAPPPGLTVHPGTGTSLVGPKTSPKAGPSPTPPPAGTDAQLTDAAAAPTDSPASAVSASAAAATAAPSAAELAERQLARLSFYPAKIPVIVGDERQITVVLDPGAAGVIAPLHLAYDPARLSVTRVDGGTLPGAHGTIDIKATQTAPLGWVTLTWDGRVTGSGVLATLTVKPLVAGEIPVIFSGPLGAVISEPGTVVSLPEVARAGMKASGGL